MTNVRMNVVSITVATPQRVIHKKTFWMSESYHRRVQKKWDRKNGCHELLVQFVEPPRIPGKVYPRMFGEDIFDVRQTG